ncbi:MAG: N-acetylmuramoyl-L-alanine amidase-like domain-containing protein [Melioribacteraceae bacterium]
MKKLKYTIPFLFFTTSIFAQTIYTQKDVEVCNTKFDFAVSENLDSLPINEVLIEIAKTFLDLDYEAHTLEKGEHEQLVVHLTGLDCYTFFESSFVFARSIKKGKTSFQDFQNEVTNIRYRDGKLDKYPSRLHYAADWLYDNDKRKTVKDITEEIGGILYKKKIDFMSTHSKSYNRLKDNPEFIKQIAETENEMNKRDYYYVPQNYISCVEDKIQSGDIVLITTGIKGLDISHTGMAIRMEDDIIHFLHAPIKGKKIQITEKPLGDYIKGLKRHTGIMVARQLEP